MLSLKNSIISNLQAIPEQTTRIIIKTREVEVIIEVDTTTEEIIVEEIVMEDMEIIIEEIIAGDITMEEIIVDRIQVIIIVIPTATIIITTIASDMNQMVKQHYILEIMTNTLKPPHFLKKFATLVVIQTIRHAIAK